MIKIRGFLIALCIGIALAHPHGYSYKIELNSNGFHINGKSQTEKIGTSEKSSEEAEVLKQTNNQVYNVGYQLLQNAQQVIQYQTDQEKLIEQQQEELQQPQAITPLNEMITQADVLEVSDMSGVLQAEPLAEESSNAAGSNDELKQPQVVLVSNSNSQLAQSQFPQPLVQQNESEGSIQLPQTEFLRTSNVLLTQPQFEEIRNGLSTKTQFEAHNNVQSTQSQFPQASVVQPTAPVLIENSNVQSAQSQFNIPTTSYLPPSPVQFISNNNYVSPGLLPATQERIIAESQPQFNIQLTQSPYTEGGNIDLAHTQFIENSNGQSSEFSLGSNAQSSQLQQSTGNTFQSVSLPSSLHSTSLNYESQPLTTQFQSTIPNTLSTLLEAPPVAQTVQSPKEPTVTYNKEFFYLSAPQEEYETPKELEEQLSKIKKNIRVLFIKAPENKAIEKAAFELAQNSIAQQTAIYVLTKQQSAEELIKKFQQIELAKQSTPEVSFIKYRTSEEAENAQKSIQRQYEQLNGPNLYNGPAIAVAHDYLDSKPEAKTKLIEPPKLNLQYLPPFSKLTKKTT